MGPPPLRFTHFVKKSSLYVLSSILCLPDQSVEQPRLPSPPCRHLEGDSTVLVSPHKQGPVVAEGLHRCHLGDRQAYNIYNFGTGTSCGIALENDPEKMVLPEPLSSRSCHLSKCPLQYFAIFSVHWILLCLRHCNNGGSWFQGRQVGVVDDHIEVVHA